MHAELQTVHEHLLKGSTELEPPRLARRGLLDLLGDSLAAPPRADVPALDVGAGTAPSLILPSGHRIRVRRRLVDITRNGTRGSIAKAGGGAVKGS